MEDTGPISDPEAKSVRQIRIRYSDIEEQNSDPFMRHWIMLKNLGQIRLGSDFEGHLLKIFINTGAKLQYHHQKILFYFGGARSKMRFLSWSFWGYRNQLGWWSTSRSIWGQDDIHDRSENHLGDFPFGTGIFNYGPRLGGFGYGSHMI